MQTDAVGGFEPEVRRSTKRKRELAHVPFGEEKALAAIRSNQKNHLYLLMRVGFYMQTDAVGGFEPEVRRPFSYFCSVD